MTSIVDTFDRANSASSLGTTSDGSATWVATKGTWGINTNQAYVSVAGVSVAAVDAATADTSASIVLATISAAAAGLAFRIADANNYWIILGHVTSGSQGLWKVASNTFTHVSTFTVPAGATVSVVTSWTSITAKVNGAVAATTTDSFNSTATKFGMYSEDTGNRLDSFSIPENVPSPPVYRRPRINVPRNRAALRASVI